MSSTVINACTNTEWLAVFGSKSGNRVDITFQNFPLFAIVKSGKETKPVPWVLADDNSFLLAEDMPGFLGIEERFPSEEEQEEADMRWRKYVKAEKIRLPSDDDDDDLEDDDDFEDEDDDEDDEDEDELEADADDDEPEGRTEH